MKKAILATVSLALLFGCATAQTEQIDTSYGKDGKPLRTQVTRVWLGTLFDGNSNLSQFKANTTDRSQSTAIGTLNQSSSGSNAVTTLRLLIEGASPVP
jgi:hypothetical protein